MPTGKATFYVIRAQNIASDSFIRVPYQINIGDAWKEVKGMQINIGDAWKEVTGVQVNIGDVWKTIF